MAPDHVALLELFQRAQARFTDRVDAVGPGQWDDECLPGWTVADLVAHLVAEQRWAPALLAGESVAEAGTRVPTGTEALLDGDPLGTWEAAADAALTAWADPAAMSSTVDLSAGPTVGTDYLAEMTVDLTVHAWDLARATGGDTVLDDELVQAGLVYAEHRLGPDGVPGLVDPAVPVPAGADAQTRLLARFGRRS